MDYRNHQGTFTDSSTVSDPCKLMSVQAGRWSNKIGVTRRQLNFSYVSVPKWGFCEQFDNLETGSYPPFFLNQT
jgi:hypothetical protein